MVRVTVTGAAFTVRAKLVLVLASFAAAQFPVLVRLGAHDVRFPEAAAPPAVLAGLLFAVGVGLAAIVPSLVYLLRVYKAPPSSPPAA